MKNYNPKMLQLQTKTEKLDFVKMSMFVHPCFHNFFVTESTYSSGFEFKNIL